MRYLHYFLCSLILAGCNFAPSVPTPTVESVVTLTPTEAVSSPTPEASPSLTPSTMPSSVPRLEVVPTNTPGLPTETSTPEPTLGPFEHTIAEGENLIIIIQQYGYDDLSVLDEVVRINPNIPNADRLPGPGNVIRIPRPSPTPTPQGFELTTVARGGTPVVDASASYSVAQHEVLDGQTIIGIAGEYEMTLRQLDQLNPDLLFFNCDFSNPSGGPDCNVPLSVGQLVNVYAPTPTPTLSPTPSGSETPTATPTPAAPVMVYPPEGAAAQGSSINLQWASIGVLPDSQFYMVEVEDLTTGLTHPTVTRNTDYWLSIPGDGQVHQIRWRVRIVTPNNEGAYRPLGVEPPWRTFQWTR